MQLVNTLAAVFGVLALGLYSLRPPPHTNVPVEHLAGGPTWVRCEKGFRDTAYRGEPGCSPMSLSGASPGGGACGRVVLEKAVSPNEAAALRGVADKAWRAAAWIESKQAGGSSAEQRQKPLVFELSTGAVTFRSQFVDIFKAQGKLRPVDRFTPEELRAVAAVVPRIQKAIHAVFGTPNAMLVQPTFFARIEGQPNQSQPVSKPEPEPDIGRAAWAKRTRDQYWEAHVDRETYTYFDYSTLLYLSEAGEEFTGGKLVFRDGFRRQVVYPKIGRLVMFTSGAENIHQVEPVTSGQRYVMTMSFSCNQAVATQRFLDKAIAMATLNALEPVES